METLQRIYGISFPDPKLLKEWEKFQEEAKNRDHRKIGRVRESGPGSPLSVPRLIWAEPTALGFILKRTVLSRR